MRKVLVIDDSEVNLYLIQAIFENDPDIQVLIEDDSTKAIFLLKKNLPDMLVLDLMMPVVDGFQILKQISEDSELCNIPVLVVSAKQDDETIQRVTNYGVVGFIDKPIKMSEIEKIIRETISFKLKKNLH